MGFALVCPSGTSCSGFRTSSGRISRRVRDVTKARRARHRVDPDPLAAIVGARVQRFRRDAEYTFDAFVEETGLGRGYISELERGLVVPTIGALSRVARALDVTLADLVLGDSERERLFEDLRGQRPALIRELRERLRAARIRTDAGDSQE